MDKGDTVHRRGEQEQDKIMGKKKLQNIAYYLSYAESIFNIYKHTHMTRKQKRHSERKAIGIGEESWGW